MVRLTDLQYRRTIAVATQLRKDIAQFADKGMDGSRYEPFYHDYREFRCFFSGLSSQDGRLQEMIMQIPELPAPRAWPVRWPGLTELLFSSDEPVVVGWLALMFFPLLPAYLIFRAVKIKKTERRLLQAEETLAGLVQYLFWEKPVLFRPE